MYQPEHISYLRRLHDHLTALEAEAVKDITVTGDVRRGRAEALAYVKRELYGRIITLERVLSDELEQMAASEGAD